MVAAFVTQPVVYVTRATRIAERCVTELHLEAPIDLRIVANAHEVPIRPLPPGGDRDADAFLAYLPVNASWSVFYNPFFGDMRRRRFSIAHELGHYLLHRELIVAGRDMDHRYYEDEANEFAAALLMPAGEISYARMWWKRNPEDYFKVSAAAWQRRLDLLRRRGF